MALQPIPGGWWLAYQPRWLNTPQYSPKVFDAAGEKVAMVFEAPDNATIEAIEFKLATVPSAQDVKVSLQDVDVDGEPDEVIDQFRVVPASQIIANAWVVTGAVTSDGTDGGTRRTVTRGQRLAIVWEFDSVVGNVNVNAFQEAHWNRGIYALNKTAGAWAKATHTVACAIRYSDGTYATIPDMWPVSSLSSTTYASDSSPDEYALRFRVPVRCRLDAVSFALDNAIGLAQYEIRLYNAADGVVDSLTVDNPHNIGDGQNTYVLPTQPILEPNVTYRVSARALLTAGAGGNMAIKRFGTNTDALMAAVPGGGEWFLSTRTNLGAWTDTLSERPWAMLRISHVDDATQVDFPGGMWQKMVSWSSIPQYNVSSLLQINAAGEKTALVVPITQDGTIDRVAFRLSQVGSAQDVKVSFQNLDANGDYDGTIDQFRVVPAASLIANSWVETGLVTSDGTDSGSKRVVSRGQWIAIVLEFDSVVGDVRLTTYEGGPDQNTQYGIRPPTNHQSPGTPFALLYSDGSYSRLPDVWPASAITTISGLNNGSSPDEYALRFTVPIDVALEGASCLGDLDQSVDYVLYDEDDVVIETRTVAGTLTGGQRQSGGAVEVFVTFVTRPVLRTGHFYRMAIRPSAASPNITIYTQTSPSLEVHSAQPTGPDQYLSTRTNGGAWTDTPTQRPWFALRYASVQGTPAEVVFPPGADVAGNFIGLTWVEFALQDNEGP